MITLLRKEINDFLDALIAYVVIGVFLIGIGLLMWVFPDTNVMDYGYASMETLFAVAPYVFMFLVPAVTMKSFAEEKRNGTIELLYTLPFRNRDIIGGKFLACFILVIFSILPTLIYYVSISYLGNPTANLDTPGIIGSYVGLLLLGAVFTAIGILSSAMTGNQIVSFILAAFLCFLFYSGFDSIAAIDAWAASSFYIRQLGILYHYEVLARGLIDSANVFYFIAMTLLFLFLCHVTLQLQKQ